MRAAVLDQAGQAITVRDDVDIIDPRPGEVRVRVHYCGLCHSDYGFVDGSTPAPGPVVLGHEASGVVDAVGAGVTHLAVGDKVVLTPAPPCGKCYYCVRGEHSLCVDAIGIMTGTLPDGSTGLSHGDTTLYRGCGVGGLAEYAITTAAGAIKIDDDVPLEIACVIGCAMQTGVGAVLNTARVEEGATVLVLGLGGVGLATVQGARLAGATTIIASDPVAERREAALEFGATHAIDPTTDDLPALCQQLTGGIGLDYAFETAGRAALVEQGLQLTRSGGTTVCVGAPPLEESITIPHAVIFAATEKKLCGCMLGSCNSLHDVPRMIRLWKQGRLNLEGMVTSRRPLAEINEGFDDLANSRGIRTVIEIG